MEPPPQPWFSFEQSTSISSLRDVSSPVAISKAPVVENDQQEPHCPWFFTGVTAPFETQSTESASGAPSYTWVPTFSRPPQRFSGFLYPKCDLAKSSGDSSAKGLRPSLYLWSFAFSLSMKLYVALNFSNL